MKTIEEVLDATYTVKVWTRKRHDQQVIKFYDKNMNLIGLNFHHGTMEIDSYYLKPDLSLMSVYKRLVIWRLSDKATIQEKKLIAEAIEKWLWYISDLGQDKDYAEYLANKNSTKSIKICKNE